jgi:cell division protein ZapA
MSTITVTLHDRTYALSCAVGEEDRLVELARYVKETFEGLRLEHGAVGDDRLLVMTAVLLADQLWDTETARADAAEKSLAARTEVKPVRGRTTAGGPGTATG